MNSNSIEFYKDYTYEEVVDVLLDMGFSQNEIEISKSDENSDIAKSSLVISFYLDDIIPNLDHWHYLTSHDFCELRRGGLNYMCVEPQENEHELYNKIRAIYALECSKAIEGESIAFHVDW